MIDKDLAVIHRTPSSETKLRHGVKIPAAKGRQFGERRIDEIMEVVDWPR